MTVPDTPFMVVHVRRQLKRMLSSALFRGHKQQGRFIEFLVESALARQDITQTDIRNHLFSDERYEKGSTLVQQTKRLTRDLINDYYNTEGRYDPIRITLPDQPLAPDGKPGRFAPGEAYRPIFERNAGASAAQLLRMGKHFLRKATPDALLEANTYFRKVRTAEPGNPEGSFGIVELECLRTLYCADKYSPAECLKQAGIYLMGVGATASPLVNSLFTGKHGELWDDYVAQNMGDKGAAIPNTARWHAVRGAFSLCKGDFPAAAKSFTEALKLDAEAITYWWLLVFLFLIGKPSHCLFVLKNLSEDDPDSARALAAYVAGLYATRQFDKAQDAISHALTLDANDWFVRLIACLVCLARGEGDEAARHYDVMSLLLETGPLEFMPGLSVLAARMAKNVTEERFGEIKTIALDVLLRKSERRDWIQIALVEMACGYYDNAADEILQACKEPLPALYFVPFLPLFDPVRHHPKLEEMMEVIARKTAIDFPLEYLTTGRVVLAQERE